MAAKTDPWVKSALSNDSLVADLLVTLKHSSSSSSLVKTPLRTSIVLPPGWSRKKHRSKNGAGGNKEQRGSPTTHLSWSACSASDGGSDLHPPPAVVRSVKANEGEFISSYNNNKSQKRKTFVDLKDEEGPLLNGRIHIKRVSISNQESTSKRVTLNQPMAMSQNVKRIKIDYVQNQENKVERRMVEAGTTVQNRENKVDRKVVEAETVQNLENKGMVEAETTEATTTQRGFVLPDLNMAPDEDMIMS